MTPSSHHPFGPSSLRRRELCPASYRMEEDLPDAPASPDSARGTRIHAAIADLVAGTDIDEASLADDELEAVQWAVQWLRDEFSGWTLMPEVRLSCDYCGEELYYGSADIVAVHPDGPDHGLAVVDWKTGRAGVADAADNVQLAAYALAAMQTYGAERCRVWIVNPCTGHYTDTMHDDPAGVAEYIRRVIQACYASELPCRPSAEACRYCRANAAGVCPGMGRRYEALVTVSNRDEELDRWPDNRLAEFVRGCGVIRVMAAAAEEELRRRCVVRGSVAGWSVRPRNGARRVVDPDGLVAVLNGNGFDLAEHAGCLRIDAAETERQFSEFAVRSGQSATKKEARAWYGTLSAPYIEQVSTPVLVDERAQQARKEGRA